MLRKKIDQFTYAVLSNNGTRFTELGLSLLNKYPYHLKQDSGSLVGLLRA